MSISNRRLRAAVYQYVDIGVDGRSDPAYVKQVNANASDGNWWCSLDQTDGNETIRGGKPEYRKQGILGFPYKSTPFLNVDGVPNPKGVVILVVELQEIYEVRAIIGRIPANGQFIQQVRVELAHESKQFATYSDGYYYAD